MTPTREAQCNGYQPSANSMDQGDCANCGNSMAAHALAARPAPQPAAAIRVTDAMIEKATLVLLGKDEDPAPGVDWHCARDWTVSQVRTKMGQAIRAIIGTATPAPSDKIAEAAREGIRKAVASAIFDPGATEGYRGERTVTEWQTDAVMRAIAGKGETP